MGGRTRCRPAHLGLLRKNRRVGQRSVAEVLRAYAGNMAILYGLATEKQIQLMYHRRPRIRKKWYHIILRRIRRFLKTEAAA